MSTYQDFRKAVPCRQAHALGGAVIAVGLFLFGPAAAQQSQAASSPRQPAAEAGEQRGANELSPATIRMLQHSLIQGGYEVDATDGVLGPKTAAAIREFQRVKGLQPTGRPDSQTRAALGVPPDGATPESAQRKAGAGSETSPEVRAHSPSDLNRATIRAIQQALDKQGLQVGPVDGVWGEQTRTAIANLQRAHGMPASGELDAYTLAVLGLLPHGSKGADTWGSARPPGPADLDPAAIRLIQQALGERGFKVGAVDGTWGDRTVNALRNYQRNQGIEPSGDPDVYTLAALGLLPGNGPAGTPVNRQRR